MYDYLKKTHPEKTFDDSTITNFDYNINNIYKVEIPVDKEFMDDIYYRKLYFKYKENYEMILLAKKLINIINNKRIQIACKLGISTLEYEKIKDIDEKNKEWEKKRLNELQLISRKLSKIEHYQCLRVIKKEKQKQRDEKEKIYMDAIKKLNDKKKAEKRCKEAEDRANEVKKKVKKKNNIYI